MLTRLSSLRRHQFIHLIMSSNKRKRGNASAAPTTPLKIEYEETLSEVPPKKEPLSSPKIKAEIASSRTTTPKKIKLREPLAKREPPANFQAVWDIIQAFRSVNLAAVDTFGCERLADAEADPKVGGSWTLDVVSDVFQKLDYVV
jgi:hypothetical protein